MVVDTDVIIRYLTNDSPSKSSKFEGFLKTGSRIILTDVTFAEIFWTLSSFYKFPKDKIIQALKVLISTRKISAHKKLLSGTLSILENTNISFIDAYTCAYSINLSDSQVLSYDVGIGKVEGINRVEP